MNSKVAVVLLVAICALLGVGLLMTHNQSQAEREKRDAQIRQLEDKVKNSDPSQVEALRAQLAQAQATATAQPTPVAPTAATPGAATTDLQAALQKAQDEARAAQEAVAKAQKSAADADKLIAAEKAEAARKLAALEKSKDGVITQRDTQIQDLSAEKNTLKRTVSDLNDQMGRLQINLDKLKDEIGVTQKDLVATKGDKEFLLTELKRMQGDKEGMEKQLNDLDFVKEQLSRLKSEQAIARRLDWARNGTLMDTRKGGQILMDSVRQPTKRRAPPTDVPGSKLDVELHKDGTVTIRPAAPAPLELAPEK